MAHPNFPNLLPAFTAHIVLDAPFTIGSVSRGAPLTVAPFASEHSYLRSVPGYGIVVDAQFVHGSDFIRQDPSGKLLRLEVMSVLKDKSGATISYKYSGILNLTDGVKAILGGSEMAGTTGFGDAFTHVLFETGSEELRAMEEKVYVASGRFIIEEGKGPIVEYLISEVVRG